MTKYNLEKILTLIDKLDAKEHDIYDVYRQASLDGKRKHDREFYTKIEYNRGMSDGYIYAMYELREILKGDNGRLREKLAEEMPVV